MDPGVAVYDKGHIRSKAFLNPELFKSYLACVITLPDNKNLKKRYNGKYESYQKPNKSEKNSRGR